MKYYHLEICKEEHKDVHVFTNNFYTKLIGKNEDETEGPIPDDLFKLQHSRVA